MDQIKSDTTLIVFDKGVRATLDGTVLKLEAVPPIPARIGESFTISVGGIQTTGHVVAIENDLSWIKLQLPESFEQAADGQ